MHTFTALFDHRGDAEAVQARLEQLGIIDLDHDVLSDTSEGFDRDRYSDDVNPGLWGKSKGAAPPKEDRHLYEEAVRRGGFLLTVNVDDAEAAQVHQVLEKSKAVDISERERELRSGGFVPPVAAATTALATDDEVIPVVEERLSVGKRQVDLGGVRVRSYVVETPVQEQVQLREEHVEVERRVVNEPIGDVGGLFQERQIELTETGEQVLVGKEARIVEEVAIRKQAGERVETISDTVRHTEVEVEQIAPTTPTRI